MGHSRYINQFTAVLVCYMVPFSTPHSLPADRREITGQEDFARLRSLSYSETHVIMLCFSVS